MVEVASSSLTKDRGLKARLYAESGVEEYWVVDLAHELLVVHSDIVDGAYARVISQRRGERLRLLRFPDVEVSVGEVLG